MNKTSLELEYLNYNNDRLIPCLALWPVPPDCLSPAASERLVE